MLYALLDLHFHCDLGVTELVSEIIESQPFVPDLIAMFTGFHSPLIKLRVRRIIKAAMMTQNCDIYILLKHSYIG